VTAYPGDFLDSDLDRVPPHDIAAEQAAVGGMMLSQDAIADVIDLIKPGDHYRPAHQLVHEAILDLYARGEPVDAITVANEMTRRGTLGRIGGAPYLHTLIAAPPTAANAGYYARIVAGKAQQRRIIEAGNRLTQIGWTGGAEADELTDRALSAAWELASDRVTDALQPTSALVPAALEEIEAIGAHGGGISGVPTGFADLDELTNGLHPGQLVIVAARPAVGKALALDTPLPTPSGWTTMGDVQPGDYLMGAGGSPVRVTAATEVMTGRPCYEVVFSDGHTVTADADHQWSTTTRSSRRTGHGQSVVTTKEIAQALTAVGQGPDHAVPVAAPLELPARALPVDPYDLGAWLAGAPGRPAPAASVGEETLRNLGVLQDSHVPRDYLRGSVPQRRALLSGLLDVGGTVNPDGAVQFTATSRHLAAGVRELITGLGYRCWQPEKQPEGHAGQPSDTVTLTFTPPDEVFRAAGQRAAHASRRPPGAAGNPQYRYITDVREVPSVPVRCVQVDAPDHLYLCGEAMIPTHNSVLGLDFARSAAVRHGMPAVLFSLEMGRLEITMRLLAAESKVPMHAMRAGRLTDDDWLRLAAHMSGVADAPLWVDDTPSVTAADIRAKCRRFQQQHGLRLVVVDYLQLMTATRPSSSRQQDVSEMSRQLKLLAKELEVPVVALSQLNRGPEQRQDKKPMLSDMRESGSVEQDCDLAILLHREDAYERESPRAGEADLIVAKHRNGPTATVTLAFQGHYSRFVDMAPG
jgi:replicative DNA helicase